MDLRRLREETRPEHEATEGQMPLMDEDLSPALYRAVLERMLPVLLAWEAWAEAYTSQNLQDLRTMVASRRRSPLLIADLEALGAEVRNVAPSKAFRQAMEALSSSFQNGRDDAARSRAAFLGALYVMEGSTLGGQYIARHVESKLGIEAGSGAAYFRGYGEQTGARWREVQAELSAVPEALSETVIGAARATFQAFGEALRNVRSDAPEPAGIQAGTPAILPR